MYFVIHVPFSLSFVCLCFLCSHWSLVDVPLIFFCPADHVPDWQPRVLLGMVEARSVNVKKTTTTTTTRIIFSPFFFSSGGHTEDVKIQLVYTQSLGFLETIKLWCDLTFDVACTVAVIGRKSGDSTVLPHFVLCLNKGAGAPSCFLATCSIFSRKEESRYSR